MEQADEKKTAEEILDELSGWQGFEGLVMDGNFSCGDIAIEAMKAYAVQQASLATTAKQSIIDGQKERIEELEGVLKTLKSGMLSKYEAEYRSASQHNNTDGVGIHFDYMSYPAKPKELILIDNALNQTKP